MGSGTSGKPDYHKTNGSATPVYNMDRVERVANQNGEGYAMRIDVPILKRGEDGRGGIVLSTQEGYVTSRAGIPVFIQRAEGGWTHSIYGQVATTARFKTMAEAKKEGNLNSTLDNMPAGLLEKGKELFDAVNNKGGKISEKEFRKIRDRQRQR